MLNVSLLEFSETSIVFIIFSNTYIAIGAQFEVFIKTSTFELPIHTVTTTRAYSHSYCGITKMKIRVDTYLQVKKPEWQKELENEETKPKYTGWHSSTE